MHNPYYSPEKLNLKIITFDEPNLSYEFNTLCFWSTPDGRVYTANDSGCSCPIPFENYAGEDMEEVVSGLERVGSAQQAAYIFDRWNERCNRKLLGMEDRARCYDWVQDALKTKKEESHGITESESKLPKVLEPMIRRTYPEIKDKPAIVGVLFERPIKFRAWDTLKQKMLYWADNATIIKDAIPQDAGDEWTERIALMQFTGISDSKGNPIYEGDIIKYSTSEYTSSSLQRFTGVVSWNRELCIFDVCGSVRGLPIGGLVNVEVIGDIFENPELVGYTYTVKQPID